MEQAVVAQKIDAHLQLADDRPIWTRQPGETSQAWAWFQLYRSLHPAVRSIRTAFQKYKELRGEPWDGRRPPRTISMMHITHQWDRRVEEWDIYIDLEKNAAIAQAREQAQMEVAELGRNIRKAAAIAVQGLFDRLYTKRVNPITGKEEIVFKEHLSPSAIVQLAKTGTELERLALGMDSGKGPLVQVNVLQALVHKSDGELLDEGREIIEAREMQRKVIEGEFLPLAQARQQQLQPQPQPQKHRAPPGVTKQLQPATQRQERGGVRP